MAPLSTSPIDPAVRLCLLLVTGKDHVQTFGALRAVRGHDRVFLLSAHWWSTFVRTSQGSVSSDPMMQGRGSDLSRGLDW
jgi:hypothetical protein